MKGKTILTVLAFLFGGGADMAAQGSVKVVVDVPAPMAIAQAGGVANGSNVVFSIDTTLGKDLGFVDEFGGVHEISVADGDQWAASVDGDNVVYLSTQSGNPRLYIHKFSLGGGGRINSQNVSSPKISGEYVAFFETDGGMNVAYMDINNINSRVQVTSDGTLRRDLDFDSGHIVWSEARGSSYDVVGHSIDGADFVIADGPNHEGFPKISGDHVIYLSDDSIFLFSFFTRDTTTVVNNTYTKRNLDISGNHIYWSDNRNGNFDIFVHDLTDGSTHQLTDDPEDEFTTDALGHTVIFSRPIGGVVNVHRLVWNTVPVADAGADAGIALGESYLFNGGGCDPDGDSLVSNLWSIVSAPAGSTAMLDDATLARPTLIPDVGGLYVLSLVVSDGLDDSEPDYVALIVSDPLVTKPSRADGLSVDDADAQGIELSWNDQSGDETGFMVERGYAPSGPFHCIGSTVADVETYYDDSVVGAGTPCFYRVASFNAGGRSAPTQPELALVPPSFGFNPAGDRAVLGMTRMAEGAAGGVVQTVSETTNLLDGTWTQLYTTDGQPYGGGCMASEFLSVSNSADITVLPQLFMREAVSLTEAVSVTTPLDENDGALGLGEGDSLREAIAAAASGAEIVFDPVELGGKTITLNPAHGELLIDKDLTLDASLTHNGGGGGAEGALQVTVEVIVPSIFPSTEGVSNGTNVVFTVEGSSGKNLFYADGMGDPQVISTADGDQWAASVDGDVVVYLTTEAGKSFVFKYNFTTASTWDLTALYDKNNSSPKISGEYVAFFDTDGGSNVAYMDVNDKFSKVEVTSDFNDRKDLDFDSEHIVWAEHKNGSYDIVAHKIGELGNFDIANSADREEFPKISGDMVVYLSGTAIIASSISQGTSIEIINNSDWKRKLDISNNHIFWSDDRNGNFDIFVHDLTTGLEWQLTESTDDEFTTDALGQTVIFEKPYNGVINVHRLDWNIVPYAQTSGLTISGGNAVRVLNVDYGNNDVTLKGLTLQDGNTAGSYGTSGGAVVNSGSGSSLTLIDCTVRNSVAGSGGGLSTLALGSTTLIRCTISGNTASNAPGSLAHGGGIHNLATTVVLDCTVSGNTTINANSAMALGGGIYTKEQTTPFFPINLHVRNSTVAGNHADGTGGGIHAEGGTGVFGLENTIIADNTAGTASPDLYGLVTTNAGINLVEDATGASGLGGSDITGTDPLLGPLAHNGGPTLTHLPGAGSAAIDAGVATTNTPSTDQRGYTRQIDNGDPDGDGEVLDIGSVEAPVSPPPL